MAEGGDTAPKCCILAYGIVAVFRIGKVGVKCIEIAQRLNVRESSDAVVDLIGTAQFTGIADIAENDAA